MATKRPKRTVIKRGKPVRVPGGGTITVTKDGAVIYREPSGSTRVVPRENNPRRRRKIARRASIRRMKKNSASPAPVKRSFWGVQSGPNHPIGRMTKTEAEELARSIRRANRQAGNRSTVRVVRVV